MINFRLMLKMSVYCHNLGKTLALSQNNEHKTDDTLSLNIHVRNTSPIKTEGIKSQWHYN